jgi:PKD repeat protein
MRKISFFIRWMFMLLISNSINSQTCVAKFKYEIQGQNVLITNQSTYTGSPHMEIISTPVIQYISGIPIDTLTIHYTLKGKYPICLTISDKDSALCATYCDTVNIIDAPACQAKVGFFYPDFYSNSYGTTASTTYFWDMGDGTTSSKKEFIHGYAVAGEYNVCLTINDTTTGCTTKACLKRSFLPVPCSASLTPITSHDSTIFFRYQLTPSSLYPTTSFWEYGDGKVGKIPQHTYDSVKTYTVCYSAIDTNLNCEVKKTCVPVTIIGNDNCKPYFKSKIDYFKPFSFSFDNGFLNAKSAKYYWDFGDGTSGAGPNIHHQFPAPPDFTSKEYTICLKIVDTVSNCRDSICQKVVVSNFPMGIDNASVSEEEVSNLSVFPNPFLTELHVKFTLNSTSTLQFFVYNFQGQKVVEEILQKQLPGDKNVFLNLESLSNGVYLLLIKTDQNQIMKRILKP